MQMYTPTKSCFKKNSSYKLYYNNMSYQYTKYKYIHLKSYKRYT